MCETRHGSNPTKAANGKFPPPLARLLLGIDKGLSRLKKMRRPIAVPLLLRLLTVAAAANPSQGPKDFDLFKTALVLGVFAMLRTAEFTSKSATTRDTMKGLRPSDLALNGDQLDITVRWAKPDKFRQTQKIPVVCVCHINPDICAVHRVAHHLNHRKGGSKDPLFILNNTSFLTRRHVAKFIKNCVAHIGLPAEECDSCSLRSGGDITASAQGFEDNVLKVVGRWKSDSCLDYTQHLEQSTLLDLHSRMAGARPGDTSPRDIAAHQRRFDA